jgi:hypothetical protein
MALLSDNFDINVVFFRIIAGNDGDYYPQMFYRDENDCVRTVGTRICMSGGSAPSEVKLAIANLYRVMEKHHLNEHPNDEPDRWCVEL